MSAAPPEQLIRELGIFGLKTLIAINAGAAVVLIGLIGSSHESLVASASISLPRVQWAMFAYVAGLAFALLATLSTYVLAQMQASDHFYTARLTFGGFIAWMITLPALSFLFFFLGSMLAIFAVGN